MNDNRLIYQKPARNFNEANPIGNGFLGAMVYGGFPNEKLTLNQDTLWSGAPHSYSREGAYEALKKAQELSDKGRFPEAELILEEGFSGPLTASYLAMGTLTYSFGTDESIAEDYIRTLDMSEGLAGAKAKGWKAEHLVSYPHRCLASELCTDTPTDLTVGFTSELKGKIKRSKGGLTYRGECPRALPGKSAPVWGGGIRFATVIRVKTDGKATYSDGEIKIEKATRTEVFLTAETSYINHHDISDTTFEDRAAKEASEAENCGYAAIRADQVDYYRQNYGQVSLDLGFPNSDENTDLRVGRDGGKTPLLTELMFNFGRYLTIASSAPGSRATNLQGIWNEKLYAVWSSNYTVNINTEMNYWAALPCGLSEFYQPLIDLTKKIADVGRKTAKDYYHASGFVCHHNVDLWGNTNPVGGIGDEYQEENSSYAFWNGAGGWFASCMFEYYEYTGDENFLRETGYPIIREAAKFFLDILHPVDGRLAVSPSTSPENRYRLDGGVHCLGRWTTMSQSIVEDLLRNCLRCIGILHVDEEWAEEICRVIPQLRPFALDSKGRLLEWDTEVVENNPQHRHVSPLYGLYPGGLLTTEQTPELAEACRKLLIGRGEDGPGWGLAWKACLWAKLKDGNHALSYITRQTELTESTYRGVSCHGGTFPNLFCAHPPFQIEGNFGITAAIALLLLQCEDGKIRILPALPDAFPNGSVSGLCAKGNIRVSIEWKNHRAVKVELLTPIAQDASVVINGQKQRISLKKNQPFVWTETRS